MNRESRKVKKSPELNNMTFMRSFKFLISASISLIFFAGHSLAASAQDSAGIKIVSVLDKPKVKPVKEKDLAGYLLVYFKDQTQSAYFAISSDGYTFTDVNNGNPIFDGTKLAEQKGVRDPHISRGPDGAFYLAMTDLHIFAQRAGLRTTQWERPEEQYGWGNNRALVLMKSYDLIHWTHSDFRVDKAFPELGDIGCSWAPETIYDKEKGKMMIYFTIRVGNGDTHMYYSYTDDAFTRLETKPEILFEGAGIDGDITLADNKFQMFYVSGAKIMHAASDKINKGYIAETRRIDPEKVNTEAPNLFKRLGTDSWVLMYDVYGARPNNMGFSETKDFKTFTDIGHFNEGIMKTTNFTGPKHGAVIHLTKEEMKRLVEYWKMDFQVK